MKAYFYWNKSDKRYINKDIEFIPPHTEEGEPVPDFIEVEFIEASSIINPRLVMSARSNCLQANYLYLEDLTRYYYINDMTLDKGRIIVDCSVDVLMSFKTEIMNEKVFTDRTSTESLQNFYLDDDKIKLLSYPFTEVHKLKCIEGDEFAQDKNYFILAVAGAISGSEPEEEIEGGE